jgi:hypothetical protein
MRESGITKQVPEQKKSMKKQKATKKSRKHPNPVPVSPQFREGEARDTFTK